MTPRVFVVRCDGCKAAKHRMCNKCHAAYEAKRRAANPEAALAATRRSNAKVKAEMIAAFGGKCECCGEHEPEFMTLDHVNGGRKEHLKREGVASGGCHIYRRLRKQGWPREGLRLLCMNCNFATRFGVQCPHQRTEARAA